MEMTYRVDAVTAGRDVAATGSTAEVLVSLAEISRSTHPRWTLGKAIEATTELGSQPKVGTRYRVLLVEESDALSSGDCIHCHRDPRH